MIHKNQFVVNTFRFEEHKECEIDTIGRTIMAYKVERHHPDLKMDLDSRSAEESSENIKEEKKQNSAVSNPIESNMSSSKPINKLHMNKGFKKQNSLLDN